MKKAISLNIIIVFLALILNDNIFCAQNKFVSLISSSFNEKTSKIAISFEKIEDPRAVYHIYRLKNKLKINSPSQFKSLNLKPIHILDYNEDYYEDTPPATGKYYYLITVVIANRENFEILGDQNYTLNPVQYYKASTNPKELLVKYLPEAKQMMILWKKSDNNEKLKSYHIYKSQKPILSFNDLANAEKIKTVSSTTFKTFDAVEEGKYYYAVSSSSVYGYENYQFIAGQNSLSLPVTASDLNSKKLPEYYIKIPSTLGYKNKSDIQLFNYKRKQNYNTLKMKDKLFEKPGKKRILKELQYIKKHFLKTVRSKKWSSFISFAQKNIFKLKSGYVKSKLLFYQAFAYYKLGEKEKAMIMILKIKADKRFMKLHALKVLTLEKKLSN